MKYSVLLCLLLALVNSKIERKSFIVKAFNRLSSGEEECQVEGQHKDVEECKNTILKEKDEMCCDGSMKFLDQDLHTCTSLPKMLDLFYNLAQMPETKAMANETFGYYLYNLNESYEIPDFPDIPDYPYDTQVDFSLQCPNNKNFEMTVKAFTEEEKAILRSENHCLFPLFDSIKNDELPNIDKSVKCENHKLLPSSIDQHIECGYVSIKASFDGGDENIKTCMLFNENVLDQIFKTGLLDELIKKAKEESGGEDDDDDDEEEGKLKKATIEFYNSKGKKYTYTYESSCFVLISKFLLLFILFLF